MYLSASCVFLPLAFLVQLNRVESRSSPKVIHPEILARPAYDENIEVENFTVKRKDSRTILDVSAKQGSRLQQDYSCDCREYCPDPNSTELQVS